MNRNFNLSLKSKQDLKTSPTSSHSVGQLAKSPCPTVKLASRQQSEVGRQNSLLTCAHEEHKQNHKSTPEKTFQNLVSITFNTSLNNKAAPSSMQAKKNIEHLYFMCQSFRLISPKLNVYLSNFVHLQEIKKVFIHLQYEMFKRIAKSHALLNHTKRKAHKGGILTNEDDFYFALRILRYRLPKKRLKLLYRGRNAVLSHIKKYYPHRQFTVLMLMNDTDYSRSYVKELLRQLQREAILEGKQEKRGTYIRYRLIDKDADPLPINDTLNLPPPHFNVD